MRHDRAQCRRRRAESSSCNHATRTAKGHEHALMVAGAHVWSALGSGSAVASREPAFSANWGRRLGSGRARTETHDPCRGESASLNYVDRTRRLVLVSRVKSPIGFEGDTGKMNARVNFPCAENSMTMTDCSMCEILCAMRPIL